MLLGSLYSSCMRLLSGRNSNSRPSINRVYAKRHSTNCHLFRSPLGRGRAVEAGHFACEQDKLRGSNRLLQMY
jgi:hypothetical protein